MIKAFIDWHKEGTKYRAAYATLFIICIYVIYQLFNIPEPLFVLVVIAYIMMEIVIMALDLILKIRGRR